MIKRALVSGPMCELATRVFLSKKTNKKLHAIFHWDQTVYSLIIETFFEETDLHTAEQFGVH